MIDALVIFTILVVLLFLRVPVAFSMASIGIVGFAYYVSWSGVMAMVGRLAFDTAQSSELSVIPLFVLMGNFITRAGLADELYTAAYSWIGHRRGGLAMATIISCGGFSAVCGSSVATAATMAKVAMPPMRRFHYADTLATGAIAAGGTLGILIPPSVILVIYGIMTSTDIGALFIAGIIPGILGIIGYNIAISITTRLKPEIGPPGEKADWPARMKALGRVWGVLLLFIIVIGGIYVGLFTPTEAAGIGACGGFFFALFRKTLNLKSLFELLSDAAQTTAMLFFILIGAMIFSNLMNETGMPEALGGIVTGLDTHPLVVVFAIMLIYIGLGAVLDSIAMILLTIPLFFPIIIGLKLDPVWFGIIVVVVTEISLITPPVGMNIFVLNTVLPEVGTGTIFRGVTPFWMVDIVRLTILVLFPAITLFLPSTIG
ncbi:MAG: TRAP transporter large permease [Rhodospirillales bacterium]|jgi:tripartite ATP-independent transporter DctM subunit|nr:C4-dicarboxylate ABC transporter permease [Rhodospirillaceae bacterium]MDP6430306.1 TRAP transporter large permease [Rhodospirillales bacterium]MDP6646386.1 TRAP transporter large permease [Rhodospirillales bacterium]MDP6841557.1 TRAP transporter large permease [Rhodospirillales bacterium]|tara:strand:- start:127 stop:1419 length:1293 start_codon:yes stop_codon:yes gene_type:complete